MKSFNQIYKEVYEESLKNDIEKTRQETAQKVRKHYLIAALIVVTFIFLYYISKNIYICVFFGTIFFIGSFIPLLSVNNKYSKDYKTKIISPLVRSYDEHLKFDPFGRMDELAYTKAEFECYDFFYSNDYISGLYENTIPIKFGDVRTEVETEDSEGNKSRSVVFQGLFSEIKLPSTISSELFMTTVKIRNDSGNFAKMFTKKQNVNMDSQEFEKYFDVYSSNKILTMRILTSDIMNLMIDFRVKNKVKFEVTIKGGCVYLRIPCSDMFEARLGKSAVDFDMLHTYYQYIDFICQLNKMVYTVITEKEL